LQSTERLPGVLPDLPGFERAARSEAPILFVGEPGTGRSALARRAHALSAVAAGPFVEFDPNTVPVELFESELFGHTAGAFTGADRAQAGRAERADGGSLVLDHVEDTPAAAQPKLLRLLSEGVYAPLGGPERAARLRCLAIADADLLARVEAKRFRRDLYYRLEVLAFRVPALRERRADLPGVVEALFEDLKARLGRPQAGLTEESREWMARHDWPGNLRELRNTLERALLLAEVDTISIAAPREWGERPPSLEDVEREAIRRALAHTHGRQTLAAQILGISRKSLWEKRRRYGLP
jgi:DNA-binding NtrC family response regulator